MRAVAAIFVLSVAALPARGEVCLTVENVRGQSAFELEGYEFNDDAIGGTLTFCFEGRSGYFLHDASALYERVGLNTWVWHNVVPGVTEVAEIWSFDAVNRRATLARIRGPRHSMAATVGAFVGDISAVKVDADASNAGLSALP